MPLSAENRSVRRLGLTAAGLLAMLTLALTLATNVRARPSLAHTCTATDRQFIQEARTNMAAIGLWGDQYESGDVRAKSSGYGLGAEPPNGHGGGPALPLKGPSPQMRGPAGGGTLKAPRKRSM